jgi:hypothetical protein
MKKENKKKRKFRIPFIPIFINVFKDKRKRLALTILAALLFFLWFHNAYLALSIVEIGKRENFVRDEILVIPPKTISANLTLNENIYLANATIMQEKGYYQEFNVIFGDFGFWIPYILLFGLTLFFFLLFRQFEISKDLILLFIAGFNTALIVLTLAYFINPLWAIIGITLSLIYIAYRIIQERGEDID